MKFLITKYSVFRLREQNDKEKIHASIRTFAAMFKMEMKFSMLKPLSQHYDVFISYSHKNTAKARRLLEELTKLNKDITVFFDKIELQTGKSSYISPLMHQCFFKNSV